MSITKEQLAEWEAKSAALAADIDSFGIGPNTILVANNLGTRAVPALIAEVRRATQERDDWKQACTQSRAEHTIHGEAVGRERDALRAVVDAARPFAGSLSLVTSPPSAFAAVLREALAKLDEASTSEKAKRPLQQVLRDMAVLAKELAAHHGATETKVRMTVGTERELELAIDTVETEIPGCTMSNGDTGWWRSGSEGLDVVVMVDEVKP